MICKACKSGDHGFHSGSHLAFICIGCAREWKPEPEPTDEQWEASLGAYYTAGWTDEPGDFERMFWEAGFRAGVAAMNVEVGGHDA